ncbi:MAG: hypothetical protein ACREFD_13160 [Stellaceae bacterium]
MNVHQYHPKGTRGTLWFQSSSGTRIYDRATGWLMGLSFLALILGIAAVA